MQVQRSSPGSFRFDFGTVSKSKSDDSSLKLEGTFVIDFDISLTCERFFEICQDKFPVLRVYTFSQFKAEKRYGGGGGGGGGDDDDNGKSAYIYIKGMGVHICGYFHSQRYHYCIVGCKSMGGYAKGTAYADKWAGCVSWYLPLIATNRTYYSYGYE